VLKISLVAACAAVSVPTHAADVYVSFDDAGETRFAERALDDSYRLLIKDLHAGGGGRSTAASGNRHSPSADIRSALESAAKRHGLEYALLYAIAQVESGFNPMAVSPKGAVGVMQLMPGTAERYGVSAADEAALRVKLHQLSVNVETGGRYLRDLMRQFNGQTELVLAAYNAGEGAVRKAGNRIPAYPETQNYVGKVMSIIREIRGVAPAIEALSQDAQVSRRDGRSLSNSFEGTSSGVVLFRGSAVEF